MKISVVIPVLNESERITKTIQLVRERSDPESLQEILVVDGGSTDDTVERCHALGVKVLFSDVARRSVQMNVGAASAEGEVLYFLHADCYPPENFCSSVIEAIESGHGFGCYRRRVGSSNTLKWIGGFSRFHGVIFRGGDASLFVRKNIFDTVGGFKNEMVVMEDFEILRRLRKKGNFKLLPDFVESSDRKYLDNPQSWRIHLAHALVMGMYQTGFSQGRMVKTYRRMVKGVRGVSQEQ